MFRQHGCLWQSGDAAAWQGWTQDGVVKAAEKNAINKSNKLES